MKYIKSYNESIFDYFKPSYTKTHQSYYKKMELKIQINGKIIQYKLHPILDAIYKLSKRWHLINNCINIYQSTQDVEDGVYTVTYKVSDTEHVDPDLPRDIAEEIVRDMFSNIDNIGFIEETTNLSFGGGTTFRRMLGNNLNESFIFEISPSYVIFTLKLEK